MMELYPALRASSMASMVSETLPIWFSLMRMALAMPSLMPRERRSVLVTKRSSPTSWILFLDDLLPMLCVKDFQPAQSSSAMPSSIETMGYFSAQLVQYADIWKEAKEDLSDFLKMYLQLGAKPPSSPTAVE